MHTRKSWRTGPGAGVLLAVIAVLLLRVDASACAVCYGAPDAPMTYGMNMAILTLLGVTGFVLAGFVAFFVHLMKRSRMAVEPRGPAAPPTPQEGWY